MSFKKIIAASIITALSIPALAQAADLTIVNNTNQTSTSMINGTSCSSALGDIGITAPHSQSTIPSSKVNLACIANPTNCRADVYMTNNCTGSSVAVVIFDTKTGIKSVSMIDNSYAISAATNSFQATISGGPALATK